RSDLESDSGTSFSANRSNHDIRDLLWPFEWLRCGVLRLRLGGRDRGRYGDCVRKSQGRLSRQTGRIAITPRDLRTRRLARCNGLHREVSWSQTIGPAIPEKDRHRSAGKEESAPWAVSGRSMMPGGPRASRGCLLRASSLFRHWSFVLRHYLAALTERRY